ncbi:hypothetical protein R3W88_029474 [Solanum pinnatisectum]|uniref:Uncharacterized protein n=1 Tax=Solanum pinnatisectum TaxID=50273 RepID=A0AAV9K5P1_9SOLN|nr:hypothetical protein R3W88_029474 [Solanum pinnatisectum]
MTRTRATITGGRGEALPKTVVESPARGRGRSRARGCARGMTLTKGRTCGAAPVRGRVREVSLKPHIDDGEDQVPPNPATTPLLQDTLLRVLSVLESFTQGGVNLVVGNALALEVGSQGAPLVVLTEDEQRRYKKFRKMDPPKFQGGKSEDAHEFLTTCRELLDVVGLAEQHGVWYASPQLCGPVREWWRTYSSLPVGSPPVTWEIFSSAFCNTPKMLNKSRMSIYRCLITTICFTLVLGT